MTVDFIPKIRLFTKALWAHVQMQLKMLRNIVTGKVRMARAYLVLE